MTNLKEHDATGLGNLVAEGQVSAKELCEATIEAIEAENPRLNAVVETCFEEALASLDGLPDGPLRGVPWLVKDLHTMVGGMAATSGSRALKHVVAAADSELVARHRRAGLVVLGKTNTPEFGMNICTSPTLFGATSNPFDVSRSAGGSSGGSAAAVAAGILPAAHATDSGGSIRIPASNCGLFGLKPTRNRVPLGNDASEGLAGLSTGHAVTHSVRDSALLLDLTHGPLFGSGGPLPPTGRFSAAVDADPGVLRVGLLTAGLAGEQIHPSCVAAAERAARLLEELGHWVEVVEAPVDGAALRAALEVMFSVNIALAATMLPDGSSTDDLEPSTQAAVVAAQTHTSVDYVHAQFIGRMITGQLNSFFGTYDLLLTPTLAHPARPLGYHDPNESDWPTYINRVLDDIPFTPLFNTSGGPAASLPLGFDDDGLPVGVQLGAAFGNEELVLSVSRQLELAAPWPARV